MTTETLTLNAKVWNLKYIDKPELPKNKVVNAGKYRFNYCPLNYVDDVLTPLMEKYRMGWRWTCQIVIAGDKIVNVIKVVVYNVDDYDDVIESHLAVGDYDDEFQQKGKDLTYLSRYLLLLALGLVADDDNDVEGMDDSPTRSRQSRASTPRAERRRPPRHEPLPYPTDDDDDEDEPDEDDDDDEEEEEAAPPTRRRSGGAKPWQSGRSKAGGTPKKPWQK
jgi:hypothetical protein